MQQINNREKLWHNIFMNIAYEISKASTCARIKVGAIIVKDRRPICTGVNGVPSGKMHCEDIFKQKYETWKNSKDVLVNKEIFGYKNNQPLYKPVDLSFIEFMALPQIKEEHGEFSKIHEIHSEVNCIAYCAKFGLNIDGATIYVTTSPCKDCSKMIVASGIKEVIYDKLYDREQEGLQLLKEQGLIVRQLSEIL